MKLYQYDHCPFCVRTDMVANYKQVNHDKVYLLNDDEKSCHDLINVKMVPILQFDDGQAMGESLDIVAVLEQHGNTGKVLRPYGDYQSITRFFDQHSVAISCLLFPRNINIGLPEFKTQSARDYFQRNKEAVIGRGFKQALSETATHKASVEAMLMQLPALELPSQHDNTISWDDVIIYPTLRNLTMVIDLHFPVAVRKYIDEVTAVTDSHCYFDRAI